jgi:hypothetical protein
MSSPLASSFLSRLLTVVGFAPVERNLRLRHRFVPDEIQHLCIAGLCLRQAGLARPFAPARRGVGRTTTAPSPFANSLRIRLRNLGVEINQALRQDNDAVVNSHGVSPLFQAAAHAVGTLDVSIDGAELQALLVSLAGAHLNLRRQDTQVRNASYLIWRPPQKRRSAPPRRAY